jgi:hypothetical protein
VSCIEEVEGASTKLAKLEDWHDDFSFNNIPTLLIEGSYESVGPDAFSLGIPFIALLISSSVIS